jgi:hypothetical protein
MHFIILGKDEFDAKMATFWLTLPCPLAFFFFFYIFTKWGVPKHHLL